MEQPNLELKSVTIEDFEDKHIPLLNTIAELIISHPDIPEDVDQANLLGSVNMLTQELRNSIQGRVPEIVKLQDDIARKNKQVLKLQETNQQLYLKIGTPPDPNKKNENNEPPKRSFEEIKRMIENL